MLETPNPTLSADIRLRSRAELTRNEVSDETIVFNRPLVISCLAFPDNRLMVSTVHTTDGGPRTWIYGILGQRPDIHQRTIHVYKARGTHSSSETTALDCCYLRRLIFDYGSGELHGEQPDRQSYSVSHRFRLFQTVQR